MSIARNNHVFSGATASSVSLSYTSSSGSNRLLVFAIQLSGAATVNATPTYGGANMTQILSDSNSFTAGTGGKVYMYYILAPATGSNTLSISFSGSNAYYLFVADYTGVLQSGFPDASTSGGVGGSSQSNFNSALTTVASSTWLFGISATGNTNTISGIGVELDTATGVFANKIKSFDSNTALSAGSKTTTSTTSTNENFLVAQVSFSENIISFSVSETITGTETKTLVRGAVFSKSETITLTEATTIVRGAIISVLETITASDIFTYGATWLKTLISGTTWTDGTKHTTAQSQVSKSTTPWANKNKR